MHKRSVGCFYSSSPRQLLARVSRSALERGLIAVPSCDARFLATRFLTPRLAIECLADDLSVTLFLFRARMFALAPCYRRRSRTWTAAATNSRIATQHNRTGGRLTTPQTGPGGSRIQESQVGRECPVGRMAAQMRASLRAAATAPWFAVPRRATRRPTRAMSPLRRRRRTFHCGLCPSVHQSGEKSYHGRLVWDCNAILKWVLIEAQWNVRLRERKGDIARVGRRVARRGTANHGAVAAARKLARICAAILRRGTPYQPDSPGSSSRQVLSAVS